MFTTYANRRNTKPARIHTRPLALPINASTAETHTQLEIVRHMVRPVPNAKKEIIWKKSVSPVWNKWRGNPNSEQGSLGQCETHHRVYIMFKKMMSQTIAKQRWEHLYWVGNQRYKELCCGNLCVSQKIRSGNSLKIPDWHRSLLQYYDTLRFQENYWRKPSAHRH